MKRTPICIALLGFAAICGSNKTVANDLAGFYVGGAIGQSHVRASQEILGDTNYDYKFDEKHTAWKLTAGIRPISALGVEFDYIDLGNAHTSEPLGFGGLSQVEAKVWTLFGVGYLPLSIPLLNVYGKLGIARLHVTSTEVGPIPDCPPGYGLCIRPAPFNISASTTHVAYGAGIERKFNALAIRAEYERISASGGNPDFLSIGVTWTF